MTREQQIDAGARYLRETMQGGKNLTPWGETPKSTKKKWLFLAQGALDAMCPPPPQDREPDSQRGAE